MSKSISPFNTLVDTALTWLANSRTFVGCFHRSVEPLDGVEELVEFGGDVVAGFFTVADDRRKPPFRIPLDVFLVGILDRLPSGFGLVILAAIAGGTQAVLAALMWAKTLRAGADALEGHSHHSAPQTRFYLIGHRAQQARHVHRHLQRTLHRES
jgi:hypothetical protein